MNGNQHGKGKLILGNGHYREGIWLEGRRVCWTGEPKVAQLKGASELGD
jgi:hypothetical protein